MTNLLDKLEEITIKDSFNVLGAIEAFAAQCREAWEEMQELKLPESYQKTERVVLSGMGGSGLGGRVVKALDREKLAVPFEVISDYEIPFYVNGKTLFIGSSYSGNTEETLAATLAAKKAGAKIAILCAGGKLAQMASENSWPVYNFSPRHNPAGQPRLALGYSIFGVLGILKSAGLVEFGEKEAEAIIAHLEKDAESFGVYRKLGENPAKQVAEFLAGRVIILVAAETFSGGARAMRNMINENGKQLAFDFPLPGLNHHLLEGLGFPKTNSKTVAMLLFSSALYSRKLRKRLELTAQVVKKQGIDTWTYKLHAGEEYQQVFEILQLGQYVSFYLSVLNGVDAGPIPWVDWFKKELKNRR